MIFPPGTAIHADSDVNARVTSRRGLGVRGVVTVRIPRVLSVRLHNNWHIRAMMRDDIGSRVRHSAIWKVRRIVLGMGKGVALSLVLLSRMRRRGWLHRDVIVRRRLSGLVHARHGRVLSVDQRGVAHRAHERRGGRCVPRSGHTGERHPHRWRGRRVRLSIRSRSCATSWKIRVRLHVLIRRRILKEWLTLSIALLVRAPLDSLFPFLTLGINALLADAILDAAQAGARVVTLLAGFLTIGAGVLDLTALGTDLGLGSADHTRSERIHVHGETRVGRRMDGQLRLNRVRGRIGGLVDPVVV